MAEPVPDVVESVAVFVAEHPPGNGVPKGVSCHVRSGTAAGVGVRLHVGLGGEAFDDVVYALPTHPVGLLGGEKCGLAVVIGEVDSECPDGAEVATGIERERGWTRGVVVGVVLLDVGRDAKLLFLKVEHVVVDLGDLAATEASVVEERDDCVIARAIATFVSGVAHRLHLIRFEPGNV